MNGFLQLRMGRFYRALITRAVAILPSIAMTVLDTEDTSKFQNILSIFLTF